MAAINFPYPGAVLDIEAQNNERRQDPDGIMLTVPSTFSDPDGVDFGLGIIELRDMSQKQDDNVSNVTGTDEPTPDNSSANSTSDTETWTINRSCTKAVVWALNNFVIFSVGLLVPYYFLDTHAHIDELNLWALVGVVSAVFHQVFAPAGDLFEAAHCGKAKPLYRGSPRRFFARRWWYNFLILDFIAIEATGVISACVINATAVFLSFKLAPVETKMFVVSVLGMFWFACWALLEDVCHIYLLKRSAHVERADCNSDGITGKLAWAVWSSLKHFARLEPRVLFFNCWSVLIKTASTVFAYWIAKGTSLRVHGSADLSDAAYKIDAVVVLAFTCCFVVPYVFLGMRIAGLILTRFTI